MNGAELRVFILGAGKAGLGLARALRAARVAVIGVHGRRARANSEGVSSGRLPASLARATVVIVAVQDAQLSHALDELSVAGMAPSVVVLQASGSAEPEVFGRLRELQHPTGTFHPLVPLADPANASAALRGAWIGVDGEPAARAAASALATALGAYTLPIPPARRALYHAGAVIASNFPAVLVALAERALTGAGVEHDSARGAVRALFFSAAENLRDHEGSEVLTGPVARGDAETVGRHLRALSDQPEMLDAYRALTRAALRLARDGGTDAALLGAIGDLVDAAVG
ncbi:MAG: DUF2520 domain-containing protein [Gemmatimonadaceae bacterium]